MKSTWRWIENTSCSSECLFLQQFAFFAKLFDTLKRVRSRSGKLSELDLFDVTNIVVVWLVIFFFSSSSRAGVVGSLICRLVFSTRCKSSPWSSPWCAASRWTSACRARGSWGRWAGRRSRTDGWCRRWWTASWDWGAWGALRTSCRRPPDSRWLSRSLSRCATRACCLLARAESCETCSMCFEPIYTKPEQQKQNRIYLYKCKCISKQEHSHRYYPVYISILGRIRSANIVVEMKKKKNEDEWGKYSNERNVGNLIKENSYVGHGRKRRNMQISTRMIY